MPKHPNHEVSTMNHEVSTQTIDYGLSTTDHTKSREAICSSDEGLSDEQEFKLLKRLHYFSRSFIFS